MTRSGKIFLINWLLPVPIAIATLIAGSFIEDIVKGSVSFTGFWEGIVMSIAVLGIAYIVMFIPSGLFALFMWLLESATPLDFSRPIPRFGWLLAGTAGGAVSGAVFGFSPLIGLGAWTGFVLSLVTIYLFFDPVCDHADRESSTQKGEV